MQKIKSWLLVKKFRLQGWWTSFKFKTKDYFKNSTFFKAPTEGFSPITQKIFKWGYALYFVLDFALEVYKGNADAAGSVFLAAILFAIWMTTRKLLEESQAMSKSILDSWGRDIDRWAQMAKTIDEECSKLQKKIAESENEGE